jgi:signal transduction histidine kinase
MPESGRSALDTSLEHEARRLHELKDELLRMLAHDLRSPLGSLLVWLELLRTRELEPETARAVGKVERGVHDVRDMVLHFLEMAQILSGTLPLEVEATDPVSAVEAALAASATAAEAKGVHVLIALDRSVPPVRADARCLRHAAACLVANAVQATPPGGSVEVRLEQERERMLIRVRDSGPGLAAAEAAAIAQSLASGLVPDGGSLRVAVAVAAARLHGGRLHAASEGEGRGCVFGLDLPVAAPPPVGARP